MNVIFSTLCLLFALLIFSFIKRGTKYYKTIVKVLKELEEYNLEVDFEDVLKFKTECDGQPHGS